MAKKRITFTTKEYKPLGNSMGVIGEPVFVNIEETDFPTKKGNKKVARICFFLDSSISEESIKEVLQISENGEVKKITFEIEVDGEEIEVIEPKSTKEDDNQFYSTASAVPNLKKTPEKNELNVNSKILDLRKFNLTDIKVKTDSNNKGTTGNNSTDTKGTTGNNSTDTKGTTGNNSTDTKGTTGNNSNQEQDQSPKKKPTPEQIKATKDQLDEAANSNDKDKIASILNEANKTAKNISDPDLKKKKEKAEDKLGEVSPEELRKVIKTEVENELQKLGIKVDDLSSESQQKLNELNNNNKPDEAKQIRKEVLNDAGVKVLDKLIVEVEEAIKLGDKKKIDEKVKKLRQFTEDAADEYTQNAYTKKKNKVQELLAKAKNQPSQNNKDNEGFWHLNNPVMWFSGVAIIGLVFGTVLIVRSRRKKSE